MPKTTKTLRKAPAGGASGACPYCETVIQVTDEGAVTADCPHFVRTWLVSADGRRRAEFRYAPTARV